MIGACLGFSCDLVGKDPDQDDNAAEWLGWAISPVLHIYPGQACLERCADAISRSKLRCY